MASRGKKPLIFKGTIESWLTSHQTQQKPEDNKILKYKKKLKKTVDIEFYTKKKYPLRRRQ